MSEREIALTMECDNGHTKLDGYPCEECTKTAPAPQASEVREWRILRIGGRAEVDGPDTPTAGGNKVWVVERLAYLNMAAELEQVKAELGKPYDKVDRLFENNKKLHAALEAAEARVTQLKEKLCELEKKHAEKP